MAKGRSRTPCTGHICGGLGCTAAANANALWESSHIEECKLLGQTQARTGALATVRSRWFRVVIVLSAVGTLFARRHAHRFVRRSHCCMHRAGRGDDEESAVGHQPESNQRNQHATGHRATHLRKVRQGVRRVHERTGGRTEATNQCSIPSITGAGPPMLVTPIDSAIDFHSSTLVIEVVESR